MMRSVLMLPWLTADATVCQYAFLRGHILIVKKGIISRDNLHAQLEKARYRIVNQVIDRGKLGM